jgi:hypothetical protein
LRWGGARCLSIKLRAAGSEIRTELPACAHYHFFRFRSPARRSSRRFPLALAPCTCTPSLNYRQSGPTAMAREPLMSSPWMMCRSYRPPASRWALSLASIQPVQRQPAASLPLLGLTMPPLAMATPPLTILCMRAISGFAENARPWQADRGPRPLPPRLCHEHG